MKTLFLPLLILFSINTFASIDFYDIEDLKWKDAKKKAKEENKLIFIDFYTTWCGPCKKMDAEVFQADAAGDYFNTRYISLKVDAEKGAGLSLSSQFSVKSYPTLMFFNADGEVVDVFTGGRPLKMFLERAKKLEDANNHLNVLEGKYATGERSLKFLETYFTRLDESNKSINKQLKEHWTSQTDASMLEAENWSILKACVTDIESDRFQYVLSHEAAYKEKFTEKAVLRYYETAFQLSLMDAFKNDETRKFNRIKKTLAATTYPFKDVVLERADKYHKTTSAVSRPVTTTTTTTTRRVADGFPR